jgi:hypothetical protein
MGQLEDSAELFMMGIISKEELLLKLLKSRPDWNRLRYQGLIQSVEQELFCNDTPNTRQTSMRTTITFLDHDMV